ncbi:MAG: DnaA regulatory inactivator Hda [Betaproteobacteria bacterium]|nr:DnaA regulatory inactivator Hda [Betaproteobacteria bacterium]
MKQLALGLSLDDSLGLEASVAGPNAELRRYLESLVAGETRERFAYLWGPRGSGRTHWLSACRRDARRAGLLCSTWPELPDAFHAGMLGIVDDVDLLTDTDQERLFHRFNAARDAGAGMLLAGSAPPGALALREDLRTRIGQALVFRVHPLGDDDKVVALSRLAHARGFDLPDDVARYLLTRGNRDLRALSQALDMLDKASLERHRPLTIPLLREVLGAGGDGAVASDCATRCVQ